MTKKERKEIYLEAYKMLERLEEIEYDKRYVENLSPFCCDCINRVTHFKVSAIKSNFPEFFLFENKDNTFSWFGDTEYIGNTQRLNIENHNVRKTALLLAAEMCN